MISPNSEILLIVPMPDTDKNPMKEDYSKSTDRCQEEDFDGHTEFKNMTPLRRLEWLCQAIAFTHEFGKAKRKSSD